MNRLLWAVGMLLACAQPATSADLQQAEALYQQGAMAKAAEVAETAGGAVGLALAAKATLVAAIHQAPAAAKPTLLDRAVTYARRALALDPNQVDALLGLALALGQKADLAGPISAHFNGYAGDGKALLDQALALEPDNAWAHGLLGIWHLQVVRFASDGLAQELYGASRAVGLERCARAGALAPDELALKYGCAVSLLELDPERYGRDAARAIEAVSRMPARDAAERLVRADAARRLAGPELRAARSADPDR